MTKKGSNGIPKTLLKIKKSLKKNNHLPTVLNITYEDEKELSVVCRVLSGVFH